MTYLYPSELQNLIHQEADFTVSMERSREINAEKLSRLEEKIQDAGAKYLTHTLAAGAVTALSAAAVFFGPGVQEIVSYLADQGPRYDAVGLVTSGLKAVHYTLEALRYLAPFTLAVGGIHTLRSIYLLFGVFKIDLYNNESIKIFKSESIGPDN